MAIKKMLSLSSAGEKLWQDFKIHCQILSVQTGRQITMSERFEEMLLKEIAHTSEERKRMKGGAI